MSQSQTSTQPAPGEGNPPQGHQSHLAGLFELFDRLNDTIDQWNPAELTPEELASQVIEFLGHVGSRITDSNGEKSYLARQNGIFLLEAVIRSLRRGLKMTEVPQEHAAVLDEALERLQHTVSGVVQNPDIEALEQMEQDAKALVQHASARNNIKRRTGLGVIVRP